MKAPLTFLLLLFSLISTEVFAQQTTSDSTSNPLQPFEFLIGGAWTTSSTYQVYEWGLAKKSVNAKLYFIEADTMRLAGDITWFWHPGNNQIIGFGTADGMGVDVFDYNTRFETPTRMINLFKAYGERDANSELQMETLEFINEDEYLWTYYNFIGDEASPAYSKVFKRSEKIPIR